MQPAIEDFPTDIFTLKQRLKGAIVFHVGTSLYLFVALAVVCEKYFVPAVQKICKALNMSNEVAGATFMAAATSAPELFVNVIGTFITESDIGIGTIVGSAVFNILAIAACCGLSSISIVPLHWWPLTRDCVAYVVTVLILICIIHDGRVDWYEALVLVFLYTVYIAVMYWDKSIQRFVCKESNEVKEENETNVDILQKNPKNIDIVLENIPQYGNLVNSNPSDEGILDEECSGTLDLLSFPSKRARCKVSVWITILPIYALFLLTIPDCSKKCFKNWFLLTFIMCIVWIGSLSYIVAWMITIVGTH